MKKFAYTQKMKRSKNIKCYPLCAVELRAFYELAEHSYNLVVAGMTKKQREALGFD